MRKVFMASAAAISVIIMPAVAVSQDSASSSVNTMATSTMTAEQKALYDAWPSDRKADFNTWTAAQKSYFWALDSEKRNGYWALTPEQRTQIQGMTPAQQAEAWASIASQLSGQVATSPVPPPTSAVPPPSASMAQAAPPSSSGNTQYINNATVQGGMTTPVPKADYPVCKGEVQDSCINRGGK